MDEINGMDEIKYLKDINYEKIDIYKPILKWVGGKTQILDKLLMEFPLEMDNYHEIFVGGGSVLFGLLSLVKNGIIKIRSRIYAYDINDALIYVYKNIQNNYEGLYDEIERIMDEYRRCGNGGLNRKPLNRDEAMECRENYYYWIRSEYNRMDKDERRTIRGSSIFIFLNKMCFRGIYRISSKGFNVPYGNYKTLEIIKKGYLREVSELIKDVIFETNDFRKSMMMVKINDYVYLDPPYVSDKDKSFVGYTENGFNMDSHNELFEMIHKLGEGKKMMLSNADVKIIRDNFKDDRYKIMRIVCKRLINSKKPETMANEVIIKNY